MPSTSLAAAAAPATRRAVRENWHLYWMVSNLLTYKRVDQYHPDFFTSPQRHGMLTLIAKSPPGQLLAIDMGWGELDTETNEFVFFLRELEVGKWETIDKCTNVRFTSDARLSLKKFATKNKNWLHSNFMNYHISGETKLSKNNRKWHDPRSPPDLGRGGCFRSSAEVLNLFTILDSRYRALPEDSDQRLPARDGDGRITPPMWMSRGLPATESLQNHSVNNDVLNPPATGSTRGRAPPGSASSGGTSSFTNHSGTGRRQRTTQLNPDDVSGANSSRDYEEDASTRGDETMVDSRDNNEGAQADDQSRLLQQPGRGVPSNSREMVPTKSLQIPATSDSKQQRSFMLAEALKGLDNRDEMDRQDREAQRQAEMEKLQLQAREAEEKRKYDAEQAEKQRVYDERLADKKMAHELALNEQKIRMNELQQGNSGGNPFVSGRTRMDSFNTPATQSRKRGTIASGTPQQTRKRSNRSNDCGETALPLKRGRLFEGSPSASPSAVGDNEARGTEVEEAIDSIPDGGLKDIKVVPVKVLGKIECVVKEDFQIAGRGITLNNGDTIVSYGSFVPADYATTEDFDPSRWEIMFGFVPDGSPLVVRRGWKKIVEDNTDLARGTKPEETITIPPPGLKGIKVVPVKDLGSVECVVQTDFQIEGLGITLNRGDTIVSYGSFVPADYATTEDFDPSRWEIMFGFVPDGSPLVFRRG